MTGNTDLANDIPTPSPTTQGPGPLVRQAREKAMISLEDLAAQIKLSRPTLDAIERDDFAQLNEPVYVRGYYRKLAKVLPVDEADLLAAYARVAGHKEPPHPSKLILAGEELSGGRRISTKLGMAIVLLGLVIGAIAFWGKNRSVNPQISASMVQTTTPEEAPAAEPVLESLSIPLVSPAPEASGDASASANADRPVDPAPESTPATVAGPLQLQYSGTSWTEVKDATGAVLLSGLVETGQQVLNGQPPFLVVLGNAPVVRITYEGQPVDITKFRRGDNTARITLPVP